MVASMLWLRNGDMLLLSGYISQYELPEYSSHISKNNVAIGYWTNHSGIIISSLLIVFILVKNDGSLIQQ